MRASIPLALIGAFGLFAASNLAGAIDVADTEAVRAAFNAETGWNAAADDLCVVTNPNFPDVAVVGTFAHDRGCAVDLVLTDGDWLAPGAASSPVLMAQGWGDGDADQMAALAMEWVDFAVFPFHGILRSANDDFARDGAPPFAQPDVTADGNGVVVTLWVTEPAGMLPETEYKLWALTFDREGRQVRTRVLDQYVVRY